MLKREEEKQKKKRKKYDPPSSQVNLLFSSWQIARRMKLEGSSPKQWWAKVWGSTSLSKSSIVIAYFIAS